MKLLVSLLAASVMLLSVFTYGQTPTVINSLPFTINETGTFILNKDIGFSGSTGSAITINRGQVTLDFNGHFIFCSFFGNTSSGIEVNPASFVTIKNGRIEGFQEFGILLGSAFAAAAGYVVEDMTIDNSTVGILLLSQTTGCLIRNNLVRNTAVGIWAQGPYNTVVGNRVIICSGQGIVTTGFDYLENNLLIQCQTGIRCNDTTTKLRFNTTLNCGTAIAGGIETNALNN